MKISLQSNQHLWYLTDEIAVLSLTQKKMVDNLINENPSSHDKCYIPSKEELYRSLFGKFH